MLAANADLEFRFGGAPPFDSQFHQSAHTLNVQHLERIVVKHVLLVIGRQKFVFSVFARK